MALLTDEVRTVLKKLADDSGVKQDAISAAVGWSQSQLSQYLTGGRGSRYTIDNLDNLARYFGTTLADILASLQTQEPLRLADDERWLQLGRALGADERRNLEAIMGALVKRPGGNRARKRNASKRPG